MVETPNPKPAIKETAVHARVSPSLHEERKNLIQKYEARTPAQPPVEDARSAARLGRSVAHRDLPRPLLLAHHRLRGHIPLRREGRAAFDDRARRGPEPLIGERGGRARRESCWRRTPHVEHGWLRSRWGCKLIALQLYEERGLRRRVARPCAARSIASASAGGGRVRSRPRKAPKSSIEQKRSEARGRSFDGG